MEKRFFISLLSLLILSQTLLADGYGDKSFRKDFATVKELFENDLYVSAKEKIDDILLVYDRLGNIEKSELEAYRLFCSIKLRESDMDGLMTAFESEYPYSPNLSRAKFYYSLYFFNKGDYSRSLEVMNSIVNKYLPKDERVEYMFNKAYCFLRVGEYSEALTGFGKVISLGNTPFKASSQYYSGYVSYILKDFEAAVKMFSILTEDHRYSKLSDYYLLESYFMLKDYKYVIEKGPAVYAEQEDDFKVKTARIISEAYFALDMAREAKDYFDIYSHSGKALSRKDNYFSGIVSYSLHSYLGAIDAFSKVTAEADTLSQSAYYHLGNSYLQVKNKHNALDAYKAAAGFDFDKTIKEEAFFQYAKLSFDVNSDISVFNRYLKEFPSSGNSDEINNYIATAYLLKKDFKSAIVAMNKIKFLTPAMAVNLQKAAFFRSMQLLERGSYRSAITDFKISIRNGAYNQSLNLLAQFWMAEAYYRTDDFAESISINSRLIVNPLFIRSGEYQLALYNLGYGYFREKNYEEAVHWFQEFLNMIPTKRSLVVEARTRIADSYFMLKDYEKAATLFEDVKTSSYDVNDIYAAYMGALAYGLLGEDRRKIDMLSDIITNKPDTPLYPKALYELGRTYVQTGENEDAIGCFNKLLTEAGDSAYLSKSLLELGMIHSNLSQYDQALGYFSRILEEMPLSEDSQNALAGIESIYQIQNKPEEYLAYLDRIGMSSIKSADEKEMMLFNSAEQIFLGGHYQEALNSLQSFIEKYPDGAKTAQAYFYLGETLSKLGKRELAADAYLKVMKMGNGSFAELSTLYYGRICLSLEQYDKSIGAFETLSQIAKLENNKYEALVGKMLSYYYYGDFAKAIELSKEVLASEKGAVDEKERANYILAKSYLSSGNRADAIPIFQTLAKDKYSDEGAECAYLLILDAYDEGDFTSVENQVYAFSDSGSTQSYWLAKSFIVLGDSFAEREEWEQALATFNSIKEGYVPEKKHDDVLDQVNLRIGRIPQK